MPWYGHAAARLTRHPESAKVPDPQKRISRWMGQGPAERLTGIRAFLKRLMRCHKKGRPAEQRIHDAGAKAGRDALRVFCAQDSLLGRM